MNLWLLGGTALAVYGLYLCFGQGSWSTKSKRFKLYKVLIDSNKAPDFSVTILKGDMPPPNAVPGFITFVKPSVATRRGLKAHQFVGWLKDFKGDWVPENFFANRAFKDMVHTIAIRKIPESVRLKAKTIEAGTIRLVDDRVAASQESAGDEHCIGFYKVENSAVVAYAANPKFQLFSDQGPLELTESIRAILYSEIESGDSSGEQAKSQEAVR